MTGPRFMVRKVEPTRLNPQRWQLYDQLRDDTTYWFTAEGAWRWIRYEIRWSNP